MNRFARHAVVVSVLAFAAALLALAPDASAQSTQGGRRGAPEKLEPPVPGQAKTDGIVMPMLLGIVLAGATVAVNLIPSKRGHQD